MQTVLLIAEFGYYPAALAARLSRGSIADLDSTDDTLGENDRELFLKLLKRDEKASGDPHAVALRMVQYYVYCNMPLYWWKQMDRYCVGKTQASSSTMYTLMNKPLTQADFVTGTDSRAIDLVNEYIERKDFRGAVAILPSSYLQSRVLMISLPTMRRIIKQRKGHKLVEWSYFIDAVIDQVKCPELLTTERISNGND